MSTIRSRAMATAWAWVKALPLPGGCKGTIGTAMQIAFVAGYLAGRKDKP